MSDLITIHMGQRYPKRYCAEHELPEGTEYDPKQAILHPEQPGFLKCRFKLRIRPDAVPSQVIAEAQDLWARLDHEKPAWIAGTDPTWVSMLAMIFGVTEVREFQPAEGDE